MESISKSRIQGICDPAHSTRTGIIAYSTRVGIPSGCHHYIRLPPLHPPAAITSGCLHYIRLMPLHPVAATFHHDVHIRNSIRLPPLHLAAAIFHPDVSHLEFLLRRHSPRMDHIRNSAAVDIPPGCITSGILMSDGRGGRFNFPGQTYPDPLIALTWRVS